MIAILSPQLESEEIDEAIEKIRTAISENGGMDEVSSLKGRKRLAFPINDHIDGNVVLSTFNIGPDKVNQITEVLRQDERYLRNMVVRV
tara:strand:- start:957 stop:1223 length:267 start_codon:yes stop_codon:yes gene_type:complete